MSKSVSFISRVKLAVAASIFAIAFAPTDVFAQASGATSVGKTGDTLEDGINKELLDSELGPTPEEAPPAAEYPYPGAKEEGIVTPDTAPKVATAPAPTSGKEPKYEPAANPNMDIERPKAINSETGDYLYDTKQTKPEPIAHDSTEQPLRTQQNGDYKYETDLKAAPYSNREGIEKPVEILSTGEFKYSTEESPQSGSASFRVGFFGPPHLQNTETHTTFQQIYTKDQLPVLFGDYEWPWTKKIGRLGLKFGSGLFVASGQGQFATVDPNRRSDDIPLERYTFLMFPNTLTVQYRFQYKDAQTIVPYIEGGAGYFFFGEIRDDNVAPKIGGALTTVAAGGLNILMDWADPQAIRNLDLEYGINHVFLTLEAREIVGLNKDYDFTSSAFNAGFLLQF